MNIILFRWGLKSSDISLSDVDGVLGLVTDYTYGVWFVAVD